MAANEDIDARATRLPIKVDQGDTLDLVWTVTDSLPLTGQFTLLVEEPKDGANLVSATCTIEDANAGTVRTVITSADMWQLGWGEKRYAFRHITGSVERTICKGPFLIERTPQ